MILRFNKTESKAPNTKQCQLKHTIQQPTQ